MMKKLGLFVLVMGLIMAFALPAVAYIGEDGKGNRFMLGGVYMLDFAALNKSKELMATAGDPNSDQTQLLLQTPVHTKLNGFIEAGNAGAFFELGWGTTPGQKTGETAYLDPRQIYGYYKFGNCEIRTGKMDGWLSTWVTGQRIGANEGHVYSFGWGHFYDGRFNQFRFIQTISPQFGWQVSLVGPNQLAEGTKASYAQLPILSAKFNLNFGVVALYPGIAWAQVKWDGLTSGYDDSMTMYYAVLPLKVAAGPFVGWFELGYGQNVANLLVTSNANTYQTYYRLNGAIKNTTQWNGVVDLAFTAGPITPHLYFGFDQATNTDAWKTGDDHNTRWHGGVSANYAVTPNFSIWPEFTYYDWGNRPGVAGAPSIGKEWILGLEFVFSF